jgi:hypothetical protein
LPLGWKLIGIWLGSLPFSVAVQEGELETLAELDATDAAVADEESASTTKTRENVIVMDFELDALYEKN